MMLYVKTRISDNAEIKIDLYEDEIYSTCPKCGKEVQVEPEVLTSIFENGADFPGTSVYCSECSKKRIQRNGSGTS